MMARSTTCSNQRPDTLMQDRTSAHSTKSSCNARPDHTFGSKAEILDLSTRCPLYPRKQTSTDAVAMSALCQNRTYAVQQKQHSFARRIDHFFAPTAANFVVSPFGRSSAIVRPSTI